MAATKKTKTKTKAKRKTKTKSKAKPRVKTRAKAAKSKGKATARRRVSTKAKPKSKSKAKTKTKSKRKSTSKAKARSKKTAKRKTTPRSKAKPRTASKTKAKSKVKSKVKSSAKKSKPAKKEAKTRSKSPKGAKKKSSGRRTSANGARAAAGGEVSVGRVKSLPRQFMVELADHIRQAVLPAVKAAKGREIVGTTSTGDPTFKIDAIAEKALLNYLKDAKAPVAYYSEDQGYTTFTSGQPQFLLVIDPIDGTRAAKSGFESCVVSVASTRVIERPRLGDVDSGCVMEIVGDRTFYAERGKGARVYVDGQPRKPRLSNNTNLELMSWSMTVTARPAELIFPTAAKLIDLTSLKGGFFACNSSSYSLTRLLTNQLDSCVDFANRYMRDIPETVEDHFINAGRGAILGVAPYDIAASLLIAEEAGCTVTDAYGKKLTDVLLLDTSVTNMRSMIAAANKQLHGMLMTFFDTRIKQFGQLLKRRAEALADRS